MNIPTLTNKSFNIFQLALLVVFLFSSAIDGNCFDNYNFSNNMALRGFAVSSTNKVYYRDKNNYQLYMMDNNGDRWERINQYENHDVYRSIAIDKSDPSIFYRISIGYSKRPLEIDKSTDGGKEWIKLSNGLPKIADYKNIFIGESSNEIYVCSSSGLYVTRDAGWKWELTSLHDPVEKLLVSPKNQNEMYALTSNGLKYSKDRGLNWANIDSTLPTMTIKGKGRIAKKVPLPVVDFTIFNYSGKSTVVIIANEPVYTDKKRTNYYNKSRVFSSRDDGITWVEANIDISRDINKSGLTEISNDTKGVIIGGYECLYKSADGIKFERIVLPNSSFDGGAENYIYDITKLTNNDGYLIRTGSKIHYVNKNNKIFGLNYGVMPHSSIDSLTKINNNGKVGVIAFVTNDNYTDYKKKSAFYTEDNGETWFEADGDKINKKNAIENLHFRSNVNLNDQSTRYPFEAYVSEDNPKKIFTNNFYLSTDDGWKFTDVFSNVGPYYERGYSGTNYSVKTLVFNNKLIAVLINSSGQVWGGGAISVFHSYDEGRNWELIYKNILTNNMGGKEQFSKLIGLDDTDKTIFIANTTQRVNKSTILESKDLGKSWATLAELDSIATTIVPASDKFLVGTTSGLYLGDRSSLKLYGGIPYWADK